MKFKDNMTYRGFNVNSYTDIGNYRYWIESNMSNWYYTARVLNLTTNEATTLCTRGKLETAVAKATEFMMSHREEAK